MAYSLEIEYFNCFVLTGTDGEDNYHVEESRIKGGFNENFVDYGVRAHITDSSYGEQVRPNAMTYSGIFNNKTGINNTNDFSIGENITKAVDIQNGSIQKLFAEDTNLNIFQEEKVSKALIDKDAIYTAEGNPITAASNIVIGQIVPYGTNYGIGKNPESFAYYAGRKYFVDKPKGAVLRLSRDGITEISNYGMRGYFRDALRDATKIIGIWDIYNKDYVLSIQGGSEDITVTFDEGVNGWTSRHSYIPQLGGSLDGKYYTFKNCDIYEHYSNSLYNNFYGTSYNSEIDVIFNANVSVSKNFYSINYEGSKTWNIDNIKAEQDTGIVDEAENIAAFDVANQDLIISGFKLQDGKFHSNLINKSAGKSNEVVFGSNMTGVKGYFAEMKIKTNATTYQELFSVSTNFNVNTY